MANRILVVDDEPKLVESIRVYLEDAGYEVFTAHNGREALFLNRDMKPDMIVLDLMMPVMDGWEAARLIRKESDVPIIMLTARIEDMDKIIGLEMGADDYITKPFNPRELQARIRAVLRRIHGETGGESAGILRITDLELDPATYEVTLRGEPVDLTRSEFDLLRAFMRYPGRVFTRMELLGFVHGEDIYAGYERTIDVHVKNIRAKVEDDPRNPRYIETVYGVGYRMRREDV